MVTLYGINNCDTVKKARKFLEQHAVEYTFHDFRKDGLTSAGVSNWLTTLGSDKLINKRSRTWKILDEKQQLSFEQAGANKIAVTTVIDNPTVMKRPILEICKGKGKPKYVVGFDQKEYLALFS